MDLVRLSGGLLVKYFSNIFLHPNLLAHNIFSTCFTYFTFIGEITSSLLLLKF
jgi:hypothetical protein